MYYVKQVYSYSDLEDLIAEINETGSKILFFTNYSNIYTVIYQ